MALSVVETLQGHEAPSTTDILAVPALYENKAQMLFGPKELRLVSQPIVHPAAEEVQIVIRSTTLCGSDVHYFTHYANGDIKIREPLSQGHESAGEVVALGSGVTSLRIGDRVALEVGVPCSLKTCEDCSTGRYNLCERMRFRSSAASFPHFQGTLRDRVNHPARWCHLLPADLSFDAGALLEPLSVAVHAVRRAGMKPGASVLVVGAGAVGLMCAAAAKAEGCADVTMTDIATNRLQFALENGFADAISVVPPSKPGSLATVADKLAAGQVGAVRLLEARNNKVGNRGTRFHTTFECTGVESCVQTSIYATRQGGKVLLVGMGTPIETLPMSVAGTREIDLLGVWRYANTYPRALEIMQAAGKEGSKVPDLQKLLTHRFRGLATVPEAFFIAARTSDEDGKLVIKVVCDGARPRCGNCKVKAKECLYKQGQDKRKISTRKAIELFSRRVSQLEGFIQAHGFEVPLSDRGEDAVMLRTMTDMVLGAAHKDSSGDDLICEDQLSSPPISAETALGREMAFTMQMPEPVPPRVAPGPPDVSKPLNGMSASVTISSESSPDNAYDLQDGVGNGTPIAPGDLDLGGMSNFSIDGMDFPDGTLTSTELNTLALEMTAIHGWDPLRQLYPTYPNHDFGMPQAPSLEETRWRIPRFETHMSGDESGDDEEDDLTNQVSDRMGSLHLSEDGELRYYGATSNLTLLDNTAMPLDHRREIEAENAQKRGQAMVDAAGVGQTINPALVQHLTSLYFAWQDPSFHVVDKDMYQKQQSQSNRESKNTTFYSETLMNTICAFGALYDARRHADLPTPLSDFFMKRAKIWLEVELDSPRVATVQALVILSSFEAAQTRDARGWLYSGMSIRLSFDLGLHIDMTPYVTSGQMSSEEAEVRKVAFWGSFIVDHLWGFYLGRPPFHINTDEVSVQKPGERVYASKRGEWVPYGLSKAVPVKSIADPIELVARQWVLLCEIMGLFCHVLYNRHDVDDTSLQYFVQNTVSQLESWKSNLPRELQVDLDHDGTVYLPHVLVLHLKYYQSMIYIHRPFISRRGSRSFPPTLDRSYLHARKVCIDSAIAISTLLRIYRTTYTLRYANVDVISIIFSAVIILIFASVVSPHPHQEPHGRSPTANSNGSDGARGERLSPGGGSIAAHLDTCCKALADLGHVFQNATRTLEVLLAIKRKWQAELLASTGSKRRGPAISKSSTRSKKRTMPQPHEHHLVG
ncbi:Fc.00g033990.m01.CDS01 [Cosmosporella sp. VM-42]